MVETEQKSNFLGPHYPSQRAERRHTKNVEALANILGVDPKDVNPAIHGNLINRAKHSRGVGNYADTHLGQVLKYVNEDMYQNRKKKGAFLKLSLFEGSIRVRGAEEGNGPLGIFIHGKVTEDKAETVIQMASLKGWRDMKLHGDETEKEKFWIALKRQDMRERIEFQKCLANGTIPETKQIFGPDGRPMEVPNEYEPLTCNFEPTPGSGMAKKWEAEKLEWEKKLQAVGGSTPKSPTLSLDDIVAKQKSKIQNSQGTPATEQTESAADALVDAIRNITPRMPSSGM